VPTGQAVFVSDTVWDVQASRKAGVRCIALLSGGIGRQELADAGAAEIYAGPGELLAALPGSLLGQAAGPAGQLPADSYQRYQRLREPPSPARTTKPISQIARTTRAIHHRM